MLDLTQLSEYAQRLATPLAGEPCGENPKNSTEYEFAKAEVAKNAGRDYPLLKESCEKVLLEQSKDLTAFGYLALAVSQTDGVAAACEVFAAMGVVAGMYWESIHPQRPVGRMNAIKWLNEEKLTGTLDRLEPSSTDAHAIVAAEKGLEIIKDLCFKHFADDPPSIKNLQQLIKKWNVAVQGANKPAPPPPPTAAIVSTEAPKSLDSSTAESTPSLALASKSDAQSSLQKIAFFYLASEPHNPIGYRLLRLLKWQELQQEPKNESGKTLLNPPNPARIRFFEGLVQSSQWDGILEKCETAFTEAGLQFWLDLQYFTCKALRGKAGSYMICAESIEQELVRLLARIPSLSTLQYKDGTPFASPLTLEWLQGLANISNGDSKAGANIKPQSHAITQVNLAQDWETAQKLAVEKGIDVAVELLASGLDYGTLREKSERKLAIARLCSLHKQGLVAEQICAELCNGIEQMGLREWAADYAAEVYEVRLRNLIALHRTSEAQAKNTLQEQINLVYSLLCPLSPVQAMRIKF